MKDAYMMRRDGKLFVVSFHYYIRVDDVYSVMETSEWLFDSSINSKTKSAVYNIVAWYAKYFLNIEDENFIEDFISCLYSLANPISDKFVKENNEELIKAYKLITDDYLEYASVLTVILNQEFLRVRYGGMYETNYGNREIYFRVSSDGFNWYPLIWEFVYDNKSLIDYVTVVRDAESSGVIDKFYRGSSDEYNHMPVDDFISEKGNPVIESSKYGISVRHLLLNGGTKLDLRSLPMNPVSAEKSYMRIQERENKNPRFWYKEDFAISQILDGENVRSVLTEHMSF